MRDEKTNNRDLRYNNHHRAYTKLPSYDVDMFIFNNKIPKLLIETKHVNVYDKQDHIDIDLKSEQYQCLFNIAEPLAIPFLVVYYVPDCRKENDTYKTPDYGDFFEFLVFPRNQAATQLLPRDGLILSDYDYCQLLYNIRGEKSLPNNNLSKITNNKKLKRLQFLILTDW